MTMGVDQTRQENAPAEIQDFIVVRGKLRKFPYLTYAIASDPHRAVFNRRAVHRDDTARANDHFPAVAAVYDRRKQRWIELSELDVKSGGEAAFVSHPPAER